jgi:hypothetical protein
MMLFGKRRMTSRSNRIRDKERGEQGMFEAENNR